MTDLSKHECEHGIYKRLACADCGREKSKVLDMNKPKTFNKEGELMDRLEILIDEYAGELSLVAVLGVLELKKHCMIEGND